MAILRWDVAFGRHGRRLKHDLLQYPLDRLFSLGRLLASRVFQVRFEDADLRGLRVLAILFACPEEARLVVVALFAVDQLLEAAVDYLLLILFRLHSIGVQLIIVRTVCFIEFGASPRYLFALLIVGKAR